MFAGSRRPGFLLAVSLVACVLAGTLHGDVSRTDGRAAELCRLVLGTLEAEHMLGRPMDDELARRLFDRYIEALDPDRLYFLESDIEEFESERDTLDDRLAAGNVEFASRVYDRLLERLESRAKELVDCVAVEHDFDKDEYHLANRHLADHPTPDNVSEVCRRHVKFLLLARMAGGASLPEARKAIGERFTEQHGKLRDLDAHGITSVYLSAAASAFDPHTQYLPPAALKDLEVSLTLRLVGIGAELRSEDGVTVVTKLVAGGAAEKDARLRPGDRVVAVGQGEKGELTDIRGARIDSVVRLIRGSAGTTVRLRVLHGDDSLEVIAIRRAPVDLADRVAKGWTREVRMDGREALTVGVVDLPAFYGAAADSSHGTSGPRRSATDVARILAGFREQEVDAVVLDLRENAGGVLDEALGVVGLFIDVGPLVQIKGRAETHVLSDARPGMAWDGPLVVLTSRYTASAAEIVAGAVQDYGRGLIVGAPATFGKGTVQSLVRLGEAAPGAEASELGALKVTVSQFYRPLGDSVQERGVAADLVVPSAAASAGEVSLPGALAFDRLPPAAIDRYDFVRSGMTTQLALLSERRLDGSADFGPLRADIARFVEIRSRKWVRLRLDDVRALQAGRGGSPPAADTMAHRAALEEALEITRDYVLALEG